MPAPVKHFHKGEPMWFVDRAVDCADDFMVTPLDKSKYVSIRIEPYDPLHPVESATRGYAELICNLLNSGVNDVETPKVKKKKKGKKT